MLSAESAAPDGQVVHAVLLPSPHVPAGHVTHPLMSADGVQYVLAGQHTIRPPVVHWREP